MNTDEAQIGETWCVVRVASSMTERLSTVLEATGNIRHAIMVVPAHARSPKARRADISVENRLQINSKLRQERNSLTSGTTQTMPLLTELEESFSGCSHKYAAPNGAEKRSFRIPQSTIQH